MKFQVGDLVYVNIIWNMYAIVTGEDECVSINMGFEGYSDSTADWILAYSPSEEEEDLKGLAAWLPSTIQRKSIDLGLYPTRLGWIETDLKRLESTYVETECTLRGPEAFKEAKTGVCECDFVTQILPYGCKCGGK